MGVITAVLICVAVLTGVAVMLALTESPMSDEPVDRVDPGFPDPALPDQPLTAADIGGLRFRIGLRGYRMDDVDAALAHIQRGLSPAEDADVADLEPSDHEA